jgi:NAD(P)-dependent dehydrogenase (short-subunit alcohol dehydrogenase family)
MEIQTLSTMLDFSDQSVVVTRGAGVLGSAMCRMLSAAGAKIAVLDQLGEAADGLAAEIRTNGGDAISLHCDVLVKGSLELAAQEILTSFGRVDILINGAGGNKPQATTSTEKSFFDLPAEAVRTVN